MKRTHAPLVAAVAGTVVLAGCGSAGGSASGGTSPGTSSSGTSSSGAGGPATIGTGSGGSYLTGDQGRAVYLFAADTSGTSTCSGPCAEAWPPVLTTSTPSASGSAEAADLGTVTRSDGATQVTYHGHPLYYFVADTNTGDTHGQGSTAFGARWWLVTPGGTALTTSGASTSSSNSSNAPSGSPGGYGGGYGGAY